MSGNYQWAKDIPCRNIQTHGYCKFENKGCGFNHDLARQLQSDSVQSSSSPVLSSATAASTTIATGVSLETGPTENTNISLANAFAAAIKAKSAPLNKSTSNPSLLVKPVTNSMSSSALSSAPLIKHKFDSASFIPTATLNKFAVMSPSLESIPSFVPSSSAATAPAPNGSSETSSGAPNMHSTLSTSKLNGSFNPETAPVFTPTSTAPTALPSPAPVLDNMPIPPFQPIPGPEEMFYQNTNLYPPNFHLYAPQPPPHVELNKKPDERTVDDLFIDREFRNELQLRNEESLKSVSNNQLDLPLHVNQYHSLYPIDRQCLSGSSYGFPSMVYKCLSNTDGSLYCMRRLQNVPISSNTIIKKMKIWKSLDCSNTIKLHEVFTTRAFGDNSLILIYDYYPLSYSLLEFHFGNKPELITEDCLWNYMFQLLNAITEANKVNLKLGPFSWSKILVTNKGRVRLADIGLKTILTDIEKSQSSENGVSENLEDEETSDLLHLGRLIYSLAKATLPTIPEVDDPKIVIEQLHYTSKLKSTLAYMFEENSTLERLTEMIAPEILNLSNGLQNRTDFMEAQLTRELENARLVRLFAKLDFISERPELVKEKSWSEIGDRYPIRLFKDYVFHQYENGLPRIDLTHVIDCLNKLDAGVDEKILLVSPDEMNCMIISYKSLKELLDKSFQQLVTGKIL